MTLAVSQLFEVVNAIKDAVEAKAEEDGKADEIKIFECVEGTKQEVVGTKFNLKIKVSDAALIEVSVFKSLPPNNSYELKNVSYL